MWPAFVALGAGAGFAGVGWYMMRRSLAAERRLMALVLECQAAIETNGLAVSQRVELHVLRDARKTVLAMDEAEFTKHARELLEAVPTVEDWEEPDGAGSQPGSAAH